MELEKGSSSKCSPSEINTSNNSLTSGEALKNVSETEKLTSVSSRMISFPDTSRITVEIESSDNPYLSTNSTETILSTLSIPSNNIDSNNGFLKDTVIPTASVNSVPEGQSQGIKFFSDECSDGVSEEISAIKAEGLSIEILSNIQNNTQISVTESLKASNKEKLEIDEAVCSKFMAEDTSEVSKPEFGIESNMDVLTVQPGHSATDIDLNRNPHQREFDLCPEAEDKAKIGKESETDLQCDTNILTVHQKSSQIKSLENINGISYRCESESWTEDESSSSWDSSSDSSDSFLDKMHENQLPRRIPNIKTKGELDLDDLPPIEDLQISVSEREMKKIGSVHAIIDKLVVIKALKDMQALDLDSVLFLSSEKPLGRIFDVFGQVVEPFYCVRFNSIEHIKDKVIAIDDDVFFAPGKKDITSYVFLEQLKNQKGSDASWRDNNEPPEEYLDYSDDEQERAAKRKQQAKSRDRGSEEVGVVPPKVPARGMDDPIYIPPPYSTSNTFSRHSNTIRFASKMQQNSPSFSRPSPHIFLSSPNFSPVPPNYRGISSPCFNQRFSPNFSPAPTVRNSFQVYSPLPSPTPFHLPQPIMSCQPQNALRPSLHTNYQHPHLFGQTAGLGASSPALQSPVSYTSPISSPAPLLMPISHLPRTNTHTNYFAQNLKSPPSPLSVRPMPMNSQWFQIQPVRIPNSHNVPPNTPLSIQIPPVFTNPPPSLPPVSFSSPQATMNAARQRFYVHQFPPNFQRQ